MPEEIGERPAKVEATLQEIKSFIDLTSKRSAISGMTYLIPAPISETIYLIRYQRYKEEVVVGHRDHDWDSNYHVDDHNPGHTP